MRQRWRSTRTSPWRMARWALSRSIQATPRRRFRWRSARCGSIPPSSTRPLHFLGTAYLVAGKYETAAATFRERIRLSPKTDLSRGLLVSALGHLGEIDEARRVWAELKEINPKYSFAGHLARLPFTNPADAERIREGFAKAGVTECRRRVPICQSFPAATCCAWGAASPQNCRRECRGLDVGNANCLTRRAG